METPIQPPPPPLTEQVVDTMVGLIDSVVALARMEASIAAFKAELIVQASEWALLAEDPEDRPLSGWSPQAQAHRTIVTELAAALRLPERTVERLMGDSGTLVTRLPATVAALQAGKITWRHVQVITDQIAFIPDDAIPAFEDAALPFAELLTVAKFDRKARIMRERLHPKSIDTRVAAATERREVTLGSAHDGMAWLSYYGPAVDAHAIYNRITDIAIAHQGPHETRTLTQLRADTFASLLLDGTITDSSDHADHAGHAGGGEAGSTLTATASVTTGAARGDRLTVGRAGSAAGAGRTGRPDRHRISDRGIRPTVAITVPVLTLLGHSDEPATLDGYGPIDLETATRLTATAPSLLRILTHPETGAVLSVGRDRYAPPKDLRTTVETRDGTCRFPGCSRAARVCDLDHTTDWADGGTTSITNLAALCPSHHNLKHHTRWTMKQLPGGVIHWTAPSGKTYPTHPEMDIRTH